VILRWEEGRAVVDAMLNDGRLQRVSASREHAAHLIEMAEQKITSASSLVANDPDTAASVAYDAARLALTAVLATQGLRPKIEGGHIAIYEVLIAQFPSTTSRLRPFDRLRRSRNALQYPAIDGESVSPDDVDADLAIVADLVEFARPLIDQLPVY